MSLEDERIRNDPSPSAEWNEKYRIFMHAEWDYRETEQKRYVKGGGYVKVYTYVIVPLTENGHQLINIRLAETRSENVAALIVEVHNEMVKEERRLAPAKLETTEDVLADIDTKLFGSK